MTRRKHNFNRRESINKHSAKKPENGANVVVNYPKDNPELPNKVVAVDAKGQPVSTNDLRYKPKTAVQPVSTWQNGVKVEYKYAQPYDSSVYEPCHSGNVELKIDKLPYKVFAGGTMRGVAPSSEYFILACGVSVTSPFTLTNIDSPVLKKKLYKVVNIAWTDYSIPNLDRDTWRAIIEAWQESRRPLLALCQGGHGRTGTALACIIGLLGLSDTPIKTVREHYCDEAVENLNQAKYVSLITGCALEDELIDEAYSWAGYNTKRTETPWYKKPETTQQKETTTGSVPAVSANGKAVYESVSGKWVKKEDINFKEEEDDDLDLRKPSMYLDESMDEFMSYGY